MLGMFLFLGELLSLVLSIFVVVLAYDLSMRFRYQRSHAAWLAITLAMAMTALARMLEIIAIYGLHAQAEDIVQDYSWLFLCLSSSILLFAFWRIKSGFDEQRRVEEGTMMRIRKFESMRMKRERIAARKAMESQKT